MASKRLGEIAKSPEWNSAKSDADRLRLLAQNESFVRWTPEEQTEALNRLKSGYVPGQQQLQQQGELEQLEEPGFLGKFADRFAPTALAQSVLEPMPEVKEATSPLDAMGKVAYSTLVGDRSIPGMARNAIISSGKRAAEGFERGFGDYQKADTEIDKFLAAMDAVGDLPIIGSMREAGEDLLPISGDIDLSALGTFGGELANLFLPQILSGTGKLAKNAGWNRMRSALGPSSGREVELLDDIGPKLMEEQGLPSFTQRGLEEKLIGKGTNISNARSNLAAEKAKLSGGTGTIDIDQLLNATEDVAMGPRAIKDTSKGLGDLPADPALAAKAREANDLVKYYQEASGTSLLDPATNTSRGLLTERDLQTLKEALQERARQGKLYDVRQGTTTPATEVYGSQAALADDMLSQISPELGEANERIHALLTAGESVKANRLGRIEGFAPPSEVSMVRNPAVATAAMGLGPLLGKLFRGATTPFNTIGGVGLDRFGGALSKLSPQESLLIALLSGQRTNENPLELLGAQ